MTQAPSTPKPRPERDAPDLSEGWGEQRSRLRRDLRRLDVLFFLICTLVGLDTIGSVAAQGPQGLTWMAILALVFFLPYGLLVAELGSAFPVQGGPYVWTRLAFGRLTAGVNQLLYWISNPVWVGGSLCIIALTTWEEFFTPLPGAWKYAAGLAFIWGGALAVVQSVRIGKWVPIAGAVARIVLLGFFLVSVAVYAARHGVHALPAGDFAPTYAGFVALVPVLIFNYVGFELPSSAAEEMKNPRRDIPLSILRSGLAALVLYGGPILGILFVLPGERIGSLGGFIDACKAVFTVYGGSIAADGTVTLTGAGAVFGGIAAAGLIVGLLTSGVTWAMGAHRAQAVACADGAGPAWLGHISEKHGTPVRVNLLSAVLASLLFVVALNLTGGDGEKYFAAGLGLTICTTFISYVITFPSLAVLRRKYPSVPRPYSVPGGRLGVRLVSGLATVFVAFTVVVLIWPGFGVGWFGTAGSAADSLPESFAGQRLQYTLSQVLPLALFVGIGLAFYAAGGRTRREKG
ncbi:putative amino acid permease [Streptomyces albiflavescens]|uniref:Amino acid permease n=1 Tax=Streptomyces albiflavescens TaxID=1623582 RepID=A0A917XYA0_9ACTN|nr:APC family permease [Streptomyces albiflavescens]GGN59335.1 putative amino acid permease [Streptomyces albiflavescens]